MTISKLVIYAAGLYAAGTAVAAAQGRLTDLRLTELISELKGEGSGPAMEELAAAGSAAVPRLVRQLSDGEAGVGSIRTVRVLGRMGAAATDAVPDLLELLPNKGLQPAIVVALGRIGPYAPRHGAEIRSAIVAEMTSEQSGRIQAVVRLSGGYPLMAEAFSRTLLDPNAPVEKITLALQHENPFVRAFAAEVLFVRGEVNQPLIDALQKAITEPHPKEVRCDTPDAAEVKLDVDLDRRIHRLAARALVRIAPRDPRSLAGHRFMIEVVDPDSRLEAVMALGHLGSAAAPAVPQLLLLLENDLLVIQREAVTTLGVIGPAAAVAIPDLEKLAEHTDRQIAERVRVALMRIRQGSH